MFLHVQLSDMARSVCLFYQSLTECSVYCFCNYRTAGLALGVPSSMNRRDLVVKLAALTDRMTTKSQPATFPRSLSRPDWIGIDSLKR